MPIKAPQPAFAPRGSSRGEDGNEVGPWVSPRALYREMPSPGCLS